MTDGKLVKLSAEHYDALTELLQGRRNRALVLNNLVGLLVEASHNHATIVEDVLNSPGILKIDHKKKEGKK